MQNIDLMAFMAEKVKGNLYVYDAFKAAIDGVANSFETSTGMKSTCMEAAILSFLRLSDDDRVALIQEIRRAEMTKSIAELVANATAEPGSFRLKTAAKVAKPGKSKGKKPPPGQT